MIMFMHAHSSESQVRTRVNLMMTLPVYIVLYKRTRDYRLIQILYSLAPERLNHKVLLGHFKYLAPRLKDI